MNHLSSRLIFARKHHKLTQGEVAEHLGVSFQAVSLWERGETAPDIDKLPEIAALYQVTVDWLLTGKEATSVKWDFAKPLSERMFHEDRMYTYIKTYATVKGMKQTIKVLPYVRALHKGQVRKGKEQIPYIYHPLMVACHALALGLDDDELVSAALLHDVCENCGVSVEELPVNDATRQVVALVTKTDAFYSNAEHAKTDYYAAICKNGKAVIVKLLDRCNNISGMVVGFSPERMVSYIKETEEWFYPMMQQTKNDYPEYSNVIFLIKYHMSSVISAIKHQLCS